MDKLITQRICKICARQYAQYTCPRCNAAYCSLTCYKAHGSTCTEAFYKEQAMSQLQQTRASTDEQSNMMRILQRVRQQQDQDLESAGEYHERDGRISGDGSADSSDTDEAGADVAGGHGRWDLLSEETLQKLVIKAQQQDGDFSIDEADLTPAEREAFHSAVAAGQLSHLVEAWQPWWDTSEAAELRLTADGQRFVAETDCSGSQQVVLASASVKSLPQDDQPVSVLPSPPAAPLPRLASLTRAKPSPLLRWQLVELLYTYCFVLRIHNGDYTADLQRAADLAFALTGVLTPAARGVLSSNPRTAGSDIEADAVPRAFASAVRETAGGTVGGTEALTGAGAATAAAATAASSDRHAPLAGRSGAVGVPPAESAAEAVLRCLECTCRPPVGDASSAGLAIATLTDACRLLSHGRPCIVLALVDLQRLFDEVASDLDMSCTASSAVASTGGNIAGRAPPGVGTASSEASSPSRDAALSARGALNNADLETSGRDGATAAQVSRWTRGQRDVERARRRQLSAAAKKLHFFSAWANEQDDGVFFDQLRAALEREVAQQRALLDLRKPGSSVGGTAQLLPGSSRSDGTLPVPLMSQGRSVNAALSGGRTSGGALITELPT